MGASSDFFTNQVGAAGGMRPIGKGAGAMPPLVFAAASSYNASTCTFHVKSNYGLAQAWRYLTSSFAQMANTQRSSGRKEPQSLAPTW